MHYNFQKLLDKGPGYYSDFSLTKKDLQFFKHHINIQWFNNINYHSPEIAKLISTNDIQIDNYHFISNELEHSKIWPKISRVLPLNFVSDFYKTDFARKSRKF